MSTPQVDFLSTPEGLGQTQPSQEVTIVPKRALDNFVADAVLEEIHEDVLMVTENPVEQGSVITDHAFKRPAILRLTYAWGMSSPYNNGDPKFIQNLYDELLALQNERIPFDVYTGKRIYKNMLIVSLRTDSNNWTENTLIVQITCQEVLLAQTEVVTVPDTSVQQDPQSTASPVNTGTKQLQPAPNFNIAQYPSLGGFPKLPSTVPSH